MREQVCDSLLMVFHTYALGQTIAPSFSHPLTHHSSGFVQGPFGTTIMVKRVYKQVPGASASQDQLRRRSRNAKTNPSSRGTRILPPVHKHKNVGFRRRHTFHLPPNKSRSKKKCWRVGKWEESTTLVTNQHINLSLFSPQQQPQKTGARHTKPELGR